MKPFRQSELLRDALRDFAVALRRMDETTMIAIRDRLSRANEYPATVALIERELKWRSPAKGADPKR